MLQDYIIDITGTQNVDGNSDTIEVTTLGHYEEKDSGKYIVYKEFDSQNPEDKKTAVIKVENESKITIIRTGSLGSRLTLELNRRHQCHYNTIAGPLMIGVFAKKMDLHLNNKGGSLDVEYTIDFNSDLVSENNFKISFKKLRKSSNNFEKDGM